MDLGSGTHSRMVLFWFLSQKRGKLLGVLLIAPYSLQPLYVGCRTLCCHLLLVWPVQSLHCSIAACDDIVMIMVWVNGFQPLMKFSNRRPLPISQTRRTEGLVAIMGDYIFKILSPSKLRRVNGKKIAVKTFPGAAASLP